MIKKLSVLLIIIHFVATIQAQNNNYLEFSVGLKKYQARDEYQSPLTYKGWAFSRAIAYSQIKRDYESRDNLEWLSGTLRNKAANTNTLNYNGIDFRSQKLFLSETSSSMSYYVGVSLKAVFGFRSKSGQTQFDTSVSLALVGAANYQKEADDRWSHRAVLSLPFFAWSVRPRYTSPMYLKPGPKWKRPSHLFITIPKFMGFDFHAGSLYEMDNGNALRFSYQSQYYQILPLHPVRVFNHGIVASALMKLN